MSKSKQRFLVVSVNWFGDSVMLTPVFSAIKKKYPDSYVSIMAVDRVRGVFNNNPYIDEFIAFDEKTTHKTLLSKLKHINYLKKANFDTVFLVHRSFTRALICLLAGIKNRIGYKRFKTSFILTHKIPYVSKISHRQNNYFRLFEKSDIPVENTKPEIYLRDNIEISEIDNIKSKYKYVIGINPSANWILKRWPIEYFSELSNRLVTELGCAVVFIGALKDFEITDRVIKNIDKHFYNFCGKTTLEQLGVLMKKIDLFISNDSGPAHLSAALDVRTLVLFGPTSSKVTAPIGKNVVILDKETKCALPCYNLKCEDNICMKSITVKEVFTKVKEMLE